MPRYLTSNLPFAFCAQAIAYGCFEHGICKNVIVSLTLAFPCSNLRSYRCQGSRADEQTELKSEHSNNTRDSAQLMQGRAANQERPLTEAGSSLIKHTR